MEYFSIKEHVSTLSSQTYDIVETNELSSIFNVSEFEEYYAVLVDDIEINEKRKIRPEDLNDFAETLKENFLVTNSGVEINNSRQNIASLFALAEIWFHLMQNENKRILVSFKYFYQYFSDAIHTGGMLTGLLYKVGEGDMKEVQDVFAKIVESINLNIIKHKNSKCIRFLLSVIHGINHFSNLDKLCNEITSFVNPEDLMRLKELISCFSGIQISAVNTKKSCLLNLDLIGANSSGVLLLKSLILFVIHTNAIKPEHKQIHLNMVGNLLTNFSAYATYTTAGFRFYDENESLIEKDKEKLMRMRTKLLTINDAEIVLNSTKETRGYAYDIFSNLLPCIVINKKYQFRHKVHPDHNMRKLHNELLKICDTYERIPVSEEHNQFIDSLIQKIDHLRENYLKTNVGLIDFHGEAVIENNVFNFEPRNVPENDSKTTDTDSIIYSNDKTAHDEPFNVTGISFIPTIDEDEAIMFDILLEKSCETNNSFQSGGTLIDSMVYNMANVDTSDDKIDVDKIANVDTTVDNIANDMANDVANDNNSQCYYDVNHKLRVAHLKIFHQYLDNKHITEKFHSEKVEEIFKLYPVILVDQNGERVN